MKRPSEILREAAELVGTDDPYIINNKVFGGCRAIDLAEGHDLISWEARAYFDLFEPTLQEGCGRPFWWSLNEKGDEARILALLFAADIAESEGN